MDHLEQNLSDPIENAAVPSAQNAIRVSNAVIQNISYDKDTAYVTIAYNNCTRCNAPEMLVTLIVSGNTILLDENGDLITPEDLQTGMIVHATFSTNMTRSNPPQAQAYRIRISGRPEVGNITIGRIINIDTRNQFFITMSDGNPATMIRFNVSPNTVVLDSIGRQIRFSRLVPGLLVSVQHASFLTASIPPQTTAFVVQIMR